MDPGINLTAGQPANRSFVERPVLREWSDERGADACKWGAHGLQDLRRNLTSRI